MSFTVTKYLPESETMICGVIDPVLHNMESAFPMESEIKFPSQNVVDPEAVMVGLPFTETTMGVRMLSNELSALDT